MPPILKSNPLLFVGKLEELTTHILNIGQIEVYCYILFIERKDKRKEKWFNALGLCFVHCNLKGCASFVDGESQCCLHQKHFHSFTPRCFYMIPLSSLFPKNTNSFLHINIPQFSFCITNILNFLQIKK